MMGKFKKFGVFGKSSFLAFVLLFLAGCPFPLSEIEFSKDSSDLSGFVEINSSKNKSDFSFPISEDQEDYHFRFPLIKASNALVNLKYDSDHGPVGVTRVANIAAKIKIDSQGKKSTKAKAVVQNTKVELAGSEFEDIDCRHLFKLSSEEQKLGIEFKGFHGFSDCVGEGVSQSSPTRIGMRRVNKEDNYYTPAEGAAMGREFVRDFIRKNRHLILRKNHPTTVYLQRLVEKLAAASDTPHLKARVFVINSNVMNAFALPGGYIFVFRGLMEKAKTEAQLAGVLGHELAHAIARHGTENITRGKKTILKVALVALALIIATETTNDEKTEEVLRVVTPLAIGMTYVGGVLHMLHKGREAELEADNLGAQYAWAAGFKPWGISEMFKIMKRVVGAGEMTSLEEIMSSHPNFDTRINRVFNLAAFFHPRKPDYINTSEAFEIAKRHLSDEPESLEDEFDLGTAFVQQVNQMAVNQLENSVLQNYGLQPPAR
jgi:Zn-dependent protease with chaperone function